MKSQTYKNNIHRKRPYYKRLVRVSTKEQVQYMKDYHTKNPETKPWIGITNYNVGSDTRWWHTWVQIHFGKLWYGSVQINWGLIAIITMSLVLLAGILIGRNM